MLATRMRQAAGGGAPASVSFAANTFDAVNRTAYTFSSQSIGTAAPNRTVIVGITCVRSGSATTTGASVTVAGNSCTKVGAGPTTDGRMTELWAVDLASGTTADIVVTWNDAALRCGIGVWAAYGIDSSAAHDSFGSSADPLTGTIDCPAGGIVIGIANVTGTSSAVTSQWTAGITEDFDQYHDDSAENSSTGASGAFASAQTGLTVTCDCDQTATNAGLFVASWGPA